MSGAEAVGLVLGIISSVIAVTQATQKIFDAAKDAKGLHEAFRKAAEKLPLVLRTLKAAEQIQEKLEAEFTTSNDAARKQEIEATSNAVEPLFETCEINARALKDIFRKVMPGDDATRRERYTKALKSVLPGKKQKVEGLMQEILESLQLLQNHHYFQAANADAAADAQIDFEQIAAGIEELKSFNKVSTMHDSDGAISHSGTGSININSGKGEQYNNSITGGKNNSQHNAKNQYFGHAAPARRDSGSETD